MKINYYWSLPIRSARFQMQIYKVFSLNSNNSPQLYELISFHTLSHVSYAKKSHDYLDIKIVSFNRDDWSWSNGRRIAGRAVIMLRSNFMSRFALPVSVNTLRTLPCSVPSETRISLLSASVSSSRVCCHFKLYEQLRITQKVCLFDLIYRHSRGLLSAKWRPLVRTRGSPLGASCSWLAFEIIDSLCIRLVCCSLYL